MHEVIISWCVLNQSDSRFLVLRMYNFFFTSIRTSSSFAIGDWATGCFPNQLLVCRMSSSFSMIGIPAFLFCCSTSLSQEVLIPSVLLISFWIIWASLFHNFACGPFTSFLKNICRDSFIPGSMFPGLRLKNSLPAFLCGQNCK